MVFSSLIFLFIFLPVVVTINYLLPSKWRNTFLLIANLIFYAWGEPVYVFLMLFSLWVNFVLGKAMTDDDEYFVPKTLHIFKKEILLTRKRLLVWAICFNLGLLFVFKYTNFAISNIA